MIVRITLTIDGLDIRVKSYDLQAAEGSAGVTATVVLAEAVKARLPSAEARVILRRDIKVGGVWVPDVLVDTQFIHTTAYRMAVERRGDAIEFPEGGSIVIHDRIGTRWETAPEEVESWPPRGVEAGITTLLDYVYVEKLGFALVVHNLPEEMTLPAVTFRPTETYHETVGRVIAGFRPTTNGQRVGDSDYMWIYDADQAVEGVARVLTGQNINSYDMPLQASPIINQAEIRYVPGGQDGRPVEGEITPIPGLEGRIISTSIVTESTVASAEDVEGDEVVVWIETSREALISRPRNIDRAGADRTVETRVIKLGWATRDEDGVIVKPVDGIDVAIEVREWGEDAEDGSRYLQQQSRTVNHYLPGTRWEVSSGHEKKTWARVRWPGVAAKVFTLVEEEEEQLTLEQRASSPGVWHKVAARQVVRGRFVIEAAAIVDGDAYNYIPGYDRLIPILDANINDTVDASGSTYQRTDYGLIRTRVEAYSRAGTKQTKKSVMEYDALAGTTKYTTGGDTGGTGEVGGKREPIVEMVRDNTSIATHKARKALSIDATHWGGGGRSAAAASRSAALGREWALEQAQAAFLRSGRFVRAVSIDLPRPVLGLRKAMLLKIVEPGADAGDATEYLVTSYSEHGDNTVAGFSITTSISARPNGEGGGS